MYGINQTQRDSLPLSSFSNDFYNGSHSSWQEKIGQSVGNFTQQKEQKLSDWSWNGIASLLKNYFCKDITQINCSDKPFWEAIFFERIDCLKQDLLCELEKKMSSDLECSNISSPIFIEKLKEEMSVDLPQYRSSLEENITALQDMIGNMLSTRSYEEGLSILEETVSDNKYYKNIIDKVRCDFHSKLRMQPNFLSKCLEGEVLCYTIFRKKYLTPTFIKELLSYYRPFMDNKSYSMHKNWLKECYNTNSLLPIPLVKKRKDSSTLLKKLPVYYQKHENITIKNSLFSWGNWLWENAGKLMTLGLASQVAAVQASAVNGANRNFISGDNSRDILPSSTINNQSLLLYNDTLIRQKRDYLLDNSYECILSRDLVINLKNSIKNALSGTGLIENSDNCEFNDSINTDNCEESFKLIECGITHLNNALQSENKQGVSLEKYNALYNSYYELQKKFTSLSNNLNKQNEQKYENELNQLKINLQELNRELTQVKHKLITKSESLCISEIANGRIDEGIREFEALGNHANLSRIIRLAYNNYEKVNEVPNIVSFISKIRSCHQNEIGYRALFTAMKESDNLDSPNLLLVESSAISTNCIMNASFKEELKSYSDKIIDTWSNNIRQGNFDQITIFFNRHRVPSYQYLENLIKKSYSNQLGHVENTIKFSVSIHFIKHLCSSYSHIFKQMEHNSGHLDSRELMILSYKLKQLMEDPGYRVASHDDTNQCTYLKEKLPIAVRKLMWGGNKCTIRNEAYQEYLFAATPEPQSYSLFPEYKNSNVMYDTNRRHVYTSQTKGIGSDGYWKIKNKDSDGIPIFKIYNIQHQEYFYSPIYEKSSFDDHRRHVLTFGDKNEEVYNGYWEIIPVDKGRAFTIKNTYNQEYLFATKDEKEFQVTYPVQHFVHPNSGKSPITFRHDSTKRRVFTWKIKNQKVPEVNWNIDCEGD